jgi:hypothetical protein
LTLHQLWSPLMFGIQVDPGLSSAAVDGSVHVWDWVDKATASC